MSTDEIAGNHFHEINFLTSIFNTVAPSLPTPYVAKGGACIMAMFATAEYLALKK